MRIPQLATSGEPPAYIAIPATRSRAFLARNYHEKSHRFIWHYHPEWELTWTSSGRGQRHVGCSVEPFEPGDLVLLAGNLPHTWHSDVNDTEDARCSVIQFEPKLWGDAFWSLPELQKFRALCDASLRGIRFYGPGVKEVGERMFRLAEHSVPDFEAFARWVEIIDLLLKLPFVSLNASGDSAPKPNPRLQQLLEWIEERSTGELTQGQVAAYMRMSPASFSRWFKAHMGCVFQRYLNELRVARVCTALADSGTSVTEAAFSAGFNNLGNFNRRFREITGLSPKQYRLQTKAKNGDKSLVSTGTP
jgi:AraC-like DNA-binding protein